MKKIIFLLLLIPLIIITCSKQDPIEKGFNYLNTVYNNGIYEDEYLKFVYPGENLHCPVKNCTITYRLMDAYFNLLFIKNEVHDYSTIKDQVDYADKVLGSLLPVWRKGKINNIIKSENGDFALDTYCILGFIYNDKEMGSTVVNSLTNNDWIEDNYYAVDRWRNIADETWCIRFLSKHNKELAIKLANEKVKETYTFINSNEQEIDKVIVAIHILYVLNDLDLKNEDFTFFQDYIANSSKNLDETLLQANILEVLSKTGYNKDFLDRLANNLIKKQQSNGAWYINEKDNGNVFTTFRAILALNAYKK